MRFHIITIFPSFFASVFKTGLMGRALEKGLVSVDMTDPRDFATDRFRHVDDRPYGGSPGMVMQPGPLAAALRSIPSPGRMLAMAPNGRPATQALMKELAGETNITILCGRYEGFDARVYDVFPMEAVSVGEIVLNGGESAALCLVEAVSRLVPGFMGRGESAEEESFSAGLLEYPHYTRPPVFEGVGVPDVLQRGDHGEIAAWRRRQAVSTTLLRRPDLLDQTLLTRGDAEVVAAERRPTAAPNIRLCLMDAGPARKWQHPLHDRLSDEDLAAVRNLAGSMQLDGVDVVTGMEGLEAVVRACAVDGAEPVLAGLCPWPKKAATHSAAQLRGIAARRRVVLLAGRCGVLDKAAQKRCSLFVRPPRYACQGRVTGRDMLVMLLDRVLGDYY